MAMSAFSMLQHGITLIRNGNPRDGARVVRAALRDENLTGLPRALGYVYLAETVASHQEKVELHNKALEADPGNADIQKRLALLLMPPPPPPDLPEPPVTSPPPTPVFRPEGVRMNNPGAPPPPPPMPPEAQPKMSDSQLFPAISFDTPDPQQSLKTAYRIVGILGGPNGPGSGFFLTPDGLLVTTRFVVGHEREVTVELETRRQLSGRVVRSYPSMDVAFVYVQQQVSDLLPITPFPTIVENTALSVVSHSQPVITGVRRETKRAMEAHWFPTDIVIAQLPDAGGGPVFDERGYVVGMITKNISSNAAYLFGVHINAIRRNLESFFEESRKNRERRYCVSCGASSQAIARGGYYCENCGTTTEEAMRIARIRTPQQTALYEEASPDRCNHCGSWVGLYQGKCLRCGRPQVSGSSLQE